jgi:hypothetical protein
MKKIAIICISLLTVMLLAGCKTLSFIPGASIGYFLTRSADGTITMEYSTDKKDALFSGSISTDGSFTEITSLRFDEEEVFTVSDNTVSFSARLSESEFADIMIIRAQGHSYVEFDLRINDSYDLARVNIGEFLNNPESPVFRLDDAYFTALSRKPWYEKNPFANFFAKLYANMVFTAILIIVLGVLIVEVLRITRFRNNPRRKIYLPISYALVLIAVLLMYLFLRSVR